MMEVFALTLGKQTLDVENVDMAISKQGPPFYRKLYLILEKKIW